jgi:hypothetical protein
MTMRLTGTMVLVLGVLVFAGGAYAGNGNGNGNGNDGAAPGNSANAPGQMKKDEAAAPVATTTTTAVTTTTATTTPAQTTTAANATGVKPSNDTAHDTHAEAQSDKTKEYGNGQTAGQIAEKNGAAGNTVLHGPGNSQPHKAASCSGGHERDVHALKNGRSGSCGGGPKPDPQPNPDPVPTPTPGPNPGPPVTTTTAATTTTTGTTTTEQQPPHSDPGSKPEQGEGGGETAGKTEGVLSATQRIGHAATLPFTGQRLWLIAVLGVILILTGLALRAIRTAEAPVESGHDHTDRSRHAARSTGTSVGGRSGR